MDSLWKLLTIVVAAVVAYVSWNQYRIARDRLRLDLFDKRYKVFDGARSMISHAVREARLPNNVIQQYWAATTDRQFLFGEDVVSYLNELDKHASAFHSYNEVMRAGSEADAGTRAEAKKIDEREFAWLADELLKGRLQAKFAPYLQFANIQGTSNLLTPMRGKIAGAALVLALVGLADWRDWLPKPDLWSYRTVNSVSIYGEAPWCSLSNSEAKYANCYYLSQEHCVSANYIFVGLGEPDQRELCVPNPLD